MSDGTSTYVGSELSLFESCTNWKSYFGSRIRRFLGRTVLEVGAGIGGSTEILCDGSQERWVCLEPDGELCRTIEGKIAEHRLPACCECFRGTLQDIPEAEEFHTILYVDVLEHVRDDAAEVARASRRLRIGGSLVVLAPAHSWLFSPFDRAIGHFRRYSHASLSRLEPPGLKLVGIEYLDSVGMLASATNRILLRRGVPTPAQLAFWDRALVPTSMRLDPVLGHRVGKSILGVWKR